VAFGPNWSPDGEWIVFGFGSFLQGRRAGGAKITLIRRDGTGLKALTFGTPDAEFPSFSADGKAIVYRSWEGMKMAYASWILKRGRFACSPLAATISLTGRQMAVLRQYSIR